MISITLSTFFTLFFRAVFIEIQFSDRCRIVGTAIIFFEYISLLFVLNVHQTVQRICTAENYSDLDFIIICIQQTALHTVTSFCLCNYFVFNSYFLSNMLTSFKFKIFVWQYKILKLWPMYISYWITRVPNNGLQMVLCHLKHPNRYRTETWNAVLRK